MIDSACFIQLLFLVLLVFPPDNFISHNPICVPLSLLFSLAFSEEDQQARICQSLSVCTKRRVIQKILLNIQVSDTGFQEALWRLPEPPICPAVVVILNHSTNVSK